ncbi:uncharacterized protein Tco025E_01329 [Trypanosoma conorhini]|uniref:SMP-LTD domain-containing protein n=1 Tax=Trypanosoma conorhini TaxID=83891 RepID=A0A3R7N6U5_9TRYP|nr:uncharacterized protein Tco025E_01329 [Trypanosoma conorhini]RNF26369.1 hypothetical protein Tco025E_01329 [Trypanosoma conorhini]
MLSTFALFVYGWILGTFAVPLCYLYGLERLTLLVQYSSRILLSLYVRLSGQDVVLTHFRRPNYHESAISNTSMSTLDAMEPAPSLSEATGVSSVRHTAVCHIFYPRAGNVFGTVYDCRLVLNDKHLLVYQVQGSHGLGSHERIITSERLQGRVRVDRIVVQPSFMPHSGRRGAGALQGHVLHIRACDGGPLFEEDGDALEESMSETLRSTRSGGVASGGRAKHPKGQVEDNSVAGLSATGGPGSVDSSGKAPGSSGGADSEADCRSDARYTVVVKFYYLREQERWQTLLEGPQEAARWRAYLRTVTTPDSFNLVLTRLLRQNMRTTALANFIGAQLQKKFDQLSVRKFPREIEGRIILDDFLIGEEVPIFSNVSAPRLVANGEMVFDFDLLYRGGATLCLRLNLTYRGFRIPHVVFSIKILYLAVRVRVSVGPPPSKKFWLGGLSPPDLRVEMHQGIQSGRGLLHRILTSLPDLSSIASNLLKLYLIYDMGLPALDDFPLPSVEKTPPPSPQRATRKAWDTRFSRRRAAAHGRGHVNAAPTAAASSGRVTPPATSLPAPVAADSPQIVRSSENSTNDLNFGTTTTPSFTRSGNRDGSFSLAPVSQLSPNSEDARRLRLKLKARELMRKAVRRVTGVPDFHAKGSS